MFSNSQLDRLSWIFGEIEVSEDAVEVTRELESIAEQFFGEELLSDMRRDTMQSVYKEALARAGHGGAKKLMSFEEFCHFILAFCTLTREAHPFEGYPLAFTLRLRTAMKQCGGMSLAEVNRCILKDISDPEQQQRMICSLTAGFNARKGVEDSGGCDIQRSAGLRKMVDQFKGDEDGDELKGLELAHSIAVRTATLFEVLKQMGVDADSKAEDQRRVLTEVQKIDTEDVGFLTLGSVLLLLRELDTYWELNERRGQLRIIEETGYAEADINNLNSVFNEYAEEDEEEGSGNPLMGVSNFRAFLRALQLNMSKNDTQHLREVMAKNYNDKNSKLDFAGFCSTMKELEAEDFLGLKQLMGRESDAGNYMEDKRCLSFFERKALLGKKK